MNYPDSEQSSQADELLAEVRFRPGLYLSQFPRPYMLEAFFSIKDRLSDAQYWRQLEYVWSMSEYVHLNFDYWLWLLRSHRRYRALMMNRKDRRYFATLPETLTIYRGYQYGKYQHKMGLSWTLSKETALWFAKRRIEDGKPMVVMGQCEKADVFCYTNEREEQEIIIHPRRVKGIKTLKNIGPSSLSEHA